MHALSLKDRPVHKLVEIVFVFLTCVHDVVLQELAGGVVAKQDALVFVFGQVSEHDSALHLVK